MTVTELGPRRSLPDDIASNRKLSEDVLQTIEVLREVTASQNMELYLVDQRRREVYRCPREGIKSYKKTRYRIGTGSTFAAYVAEVRRPMVCHDVVKSLQYPFGVDLVGSAAKRVLGVPIMSKRNGLIAVMELSRMKGQPRYTSTELEMCINLCKWMLPVIENYFDEEDIRKENMTFTSLIRATNSCICGRMSHEEHFSHLLRIVGRILNTESWAVYVKYQSDVCSTKSVKAKMVFQADKDNFERKLCFKLKSVKCVASVAMLEKRLLMADERHFKAQYDVTMYDPLDIKSSVCIPLILNGNVRGALEYMNKMDSHKFSVRDMSLLEFLASFIEFHLFSGSLSSVTHKARLLRLVDHEKFVRAMKSSRQEVLQKPNMKSNPDPQDRLELPKDLPDILSSLDGMFSELVTRWTSFDPLARLRFLCNVFNFTMFTSPILIHKIWSSVEFVYHILKTYSSYFTEVEKELILYCTLFRTMKSNNCGPHCLPKKISISKVGVFQDCSTFFFLRTLFKKAGMYERDTFDALMRKMKVILHSLDKFDLKGIKENIFKLICQKKFDFDDITHRIWLRLCILSLADSALYFIPKLLTTEIMQAIVEDLGKHDFYGKPVDKLERQRRYRDVGKLIRIHLELNVLPMLILLRIIMPETKIYLVHCLNALKIYKNYKLPKNQDADNDGSHAEK